MLTTFLISLNAMKENKMGKKWHAFIKSILHILLKSQSQKYHPTSLRNRMLGWEVCPTTLLKLPQNYRRTSKCHYQTPSISQYIYQYIYIDHLPEISVC